MAYKIHSNNVATGYNQRDNYNVSITGGCVHVHAYMVAYMYTHVHFVGASFASRMNIVAASYQV